MSTTSQSLLKRTIQHCSSVFLAIFGRISWQAPRWLQVICSSRQNKKKAIITGIIICIVPALVIAYQFWMSIPDNQLLSFQFSAPTITPNNKILKPNPLTVQFSYPGSLPTLIKPAFARDQEVRNTVPPYPQPNGQYVAAAPLKMIGKPIERGITMTPNLPGQWRWQNAYKLVFTPTADWPAGQKIEVHVANQVIASHLHLKENSFILFTRPFEVNINKAYLYQNPKDPSQHQAVAEIAFNYAVSPEKLKAYTRLELLTENQTPIPFHYSFDKNKRIAYLRSENLQLPAQSANLKISIMKGLSAVTGEGILTQTRDVKVQVPDRKSLFQVVNATTTIKRKVDNTPEQMLQIGTSIGVAGDELLQHMHLLLLPEYVSVWGRGSKYWSNVAQVDPSVILRSKELSLTPLSQGMPAATGNQYVFKAPKDRYLYLQIDQGVKGLGGYALSQGYRQIFPVPAFPMELQFLHKGALLALGGNRRFTIQSRGIDHVKFVVNRVRDEDINHLVSQTGGKFQNPDFLNYYFNESNISEGFSKIKPIDNAEPSQLQYTNLDLSQYLPHDKAQSLGLFFVSAQAWNKEHNYGLGSQIKRLVLVTNMAMLVKDNADMTHDIYISSIVDGNPVAEAKVTVLGKNGVPIASAQSDEQGHVHLGALNTFTDEQQPVVYVASLGKDVSFMPYQRDDRKLNYSRYSVGGVYEQLDPDSLRAFVFSDRGLYRPGDTVHIAAIVKRNNWHSALSGLPVMLRITDPRGRTLLKKIFSLNDVGIIDNSFKTALDSPTGPYTVDLYLRKDSNLYYQMLGSTRVNVEEFEPDTMKIKAAFLPPSIKGWIAPSQLQGQVTLANLYGTAATERKVRGRINLNPKQIYFTEYPGFQFRDPIRDGKQEMKYYSELLSDQTTDDKGQAHFDFNLARFNNASYYLQFYAEGFVGQGGRSVRTNTGEVLVSSLPYMIGYQADGGLSYIRQDAKRQVKLIAIDPTLQQVALQDCHVRVYRNVDVTVLAKRPDGSYFYRSEKKRVLKEEKPFQLAATGSVLDLSTHELGDYEVEIVGPANRVYVKFAYAIIGEGMSATPKNASLDVKLNKETYSPGETIELQVKTPYQGSGLITIEREKVYSFVWFKATQNTTLQKIQLPKDLEGNAYITVTFIRDWNSQEIYMDPLTFAVKPFAIDKEKHTVHVTLSVAQRSQPGEDMVIRYQSNKPAKLILYGVDTGILQVAGYQTPNPLQFFMRKRALQVATYQTADLILPNAKLYASDSTVGGDMLAEDSMEGSGGVGFAAKPMSRMAKEQKLLNPFKRNIPKAVTFWSGLLDATPEPKEYKFKVPDYFNGTINLMAVAVDPTAVGHVSQPALVQGHFIITPNIPLFMAPGDQAKISVTVANQLDGSGADAKLKVKATVSDNLELLGAAEQTEAIPENTEKTFEYQIKAKTKLGRGDITFSAASGEKQTQYHSSLSVRPATLMQSKISLGYAPSGQFELPLSHDFYSELATVHTAAAASPLVMVSGLNEYLSNYPYGCTEQLLSKAMPLLALSSYPALRQDPKLVYQRLDKAIAMLRARQATDGGFKFWPSVSNQSDLTVSLYATHFLTQAKRLGLRVDNDVLSGALRYCENLSRARISTLKEAREHAYAIYLMARNQRNVTNVLTNLLDDLKQPTLRSWQEDLTGAYVAAIYKMRMQNIKAERLIADVEMDSSKHYLDDPMQENLSSLARYIDILSLHFPNRLAGIPLSDLQKLVKPISEGRYNTLSLSYAILALSDYNAVQDVSAGPVDVTAIAANDTRHGPLHSQVGTLSALTIPYAMQSVEYQAPDGKPFFYHLDQTGFPMLSNEKAEAKHIELIREYTDQNGNALSRVNLGDDVTVKIHIRSTDRRTHQHIVVADLLPAGFVVEHKSINRSLFNYVDIREDRVLFFLNVGSNPRDITYNIKAVNSGEYTSPPAAAESMYDLDVRARGASGSLSVQ